MEPTNSGRVDQWSHCVESRYTELIRLCFQRKWIASLGAVSTVLCTPLPKLVENPLSRGGHTQIAGFGAFSKNGGTHTVPLRGVHVKNLNSHLNGLRNERKKDRKSSAKRAREKDRCRK